MLSALLGHPFIICGHIGLIALACRLRFIHALAEIAQFGAILLCALRIFGVLSR